MTEPTVLDIFKIAYGPLPEGVTECYAAARVVGGVECEILPTVRRDSLSCPMCWVGLHSTMLEAQFHRPLGPDIATRPASSFIGFLGDAYDKACEEWK